MKHFYQFLCAACLTVTYTASVAQVTYNNDASVQALVDAFNSGNLITVSNVTFNGQPGSEVGDQLAGFYNGLSDGLDLDSGLVLLNDHKLSLAGQVGPLINPLNGDPDLAAIAQGNVYDCAILEMDVQVNADILAFSYFFASNEYPSYTCSQFNDLFILLISGPGIDGPFSNGAVNIATIPGTDTPVAVNTVNSGTPSVPGNEANCLAANPNYVEDSIYFVANANNENSSLSLAGYTTAFEAIANVQFGETYHLKLAVADVMDQSLTSAVFLGGGSLEGRLSSSVNAMDEPQLEVYPNPATDKLYLRNACASCSGPAAISIFDLRGRLVKQIHQPASATMEIALDALERGMYFGEVDGGEGPLLTFKFIRK